MWSCKWGEHCSPELFIFLRVGLDYVAPEDVGLLSLAISSWDLEYAENHWELWEDHKIDTQMLPDSEALEPLKCEFPAIPFLGIHPKGVAIVMCTRAVPKTDKEAVQICLCHQQEAWCYRPGCSDTKPWNTLCPSPAPWSAEPVPPPRSHGFHSTSLTQALVFAYAKPWTGEEVAEARAVWTGKTTQFGVHIRIVSRESCWVWQEVPLRWGGSCPLPDGLNIEQRSAREGRSGGNPYPGLQAWILSWFSF